MDEAREKARDSKQGVAKSRLKAFSALASQGAAIIKSKSMGPAELSATFGELAGFWRAWSDAAHLPDQRLASLGGLVVDDLGQAVAAFSAQAAPEIASKGAMLSEMSAMRQALELAWEAGARKVEMRFDCMPLARSAAAALMGDACELARSDSSELLAVMDRFECIALRWIPRESNRLADALSKRPLGGGIFHGGASQAPWIKKAWDEAGSPDSDGAERERGEHAKRRAPKLASREDASESGLSKIVVGASWRAEGDLGSWIAAASCADPLAKRDARIEPSLSWALGASSEPGIAGMAAALSQALAMKMAKVATRSGGGISVFRVYMPRQVWEPLQAAGALEGFFSAASISARAMAPGSRVEAKSVEATMEISPRHAAHLGNEWEVGRALHIQRIQSTRSDRRKERSKPAGRGSPGAPS